MVIVQLRSGLGNQFYQYACARSIAHKLKTELKIDLSFCPPLDKRTNRLSYYRFDDFNIQENFATPEEIERVEKHGLILKGINDGLTPPPMPDFENFHGDILITGHWMAKLKYYEDIIDILRKEFTLKKPSAVALAWQKKILAAECSVSIHVRHGDFLYNPELKKERWAGIPQLDYYYTCLKLLKQQYKNMTAFVFSDDIQWCKENLRLDVPTEFVSGSGVSASEEFFLMSLCKHNITASSSFSYRAAFLNANPDKKCFSPAPATADEVQKNLYRMEEKKITLSDLGTWVHIPYDFDNRPDIDLRPFFSLLVVVNNDIATLEDALNSILAQDYKYYEVIIIDNASFDGSKKICQQAAKISDKVTLIRLYDKISNGAAWNKALNIAQGNFVMFLKGNDRIFPDALTYLYLNSEYNLADVVVSAAWLRENDDGNVSASEKNFVLESDETFRGLKNIFYRKFDKDITLKFLATNECAVPIATKLFDRKFLLDRKIYFDEKISDIDAELLFMTEAMLNTDNEMLFVPEPFYVAPKI